MNQNNLEDKPNIDLEKSDELSEGFPSNSGEIIKNDKYHNLDYINDVLVSKNKEEVENVQKIQGWTDGETELYSFMAKLRKEAVDQSVRELEERKEKGIPPTEEELSMGAFAETIEPQVRETVLALRKKGYNTFESGFYNFADQRIGFIDNDLESFEASEELRKKLKEEGVKLLVEDYVVSMEFSEKKDLEIIKKLWQMVENDLPNLGYKASPSTIGLAENFREKYLSAQNNPKEFKRIVKEEKEDLFAVGILDTFNLSYSDLENKSILDIGAGNANLGRACKRRGIDILSLDRESLEENNDEIAFIQGQVEDTKLDDEKFDLIISHAAPPTISDNVDKIRGVINEVKRLLKSGGEFRFGPLGLNPEVFGDDELFSKEEENNFTIEQRIERVREKSLEILKAIDVRIEEDRSNERGYYILKQ